jgi:hypothetical protein
VQVSADGGNTWTDLFVEAGSNGSGESSFTPQSLSLSNYAGQLTMLRFNYAFSGGSYYPDIDNYVGWDIENIAISNTLQQVVALLTTTNFTFTPPTTGAYLLQAQPVIYTQYPLNFGPPKVINVVSNFSGEILMSQPIVTGGQVLLTFTVTGLSTPTFHLLQTGQLGAGWTTNTAAPLTTNGPSSYRFTTPSGPSARFYQIKAP